MTEVSQVAIRCNTSLVKGVGVCLVAAALSTPAVPGAQVPNREMAAALASIYRLHSYTAFDWIEGRFEKGTLTLQGFARTRQLKDLAEATARTTPGVEEVDNQIELLPSHATDDDVRVRAYAALYASGALERYAPGGQLTGAALRELEETARVGLDAADVGRGPHGIHIIVSAARVLLLGQVRTTGDRQMAEARIRPLPGVLGVVNQLRVAERQ